jgi:hypothetical protein
MCCALCQKSKPLRSSHIVPEFLYQEMYDPKHRFLGLSRIPSDRVLLYQKGLREKLLCGDCEQQFGRYESYAARVFYGGAKLVVRQEGKRFTIAGAEYKPLKLFFLSLLWRFGVTSLPGFSGADLGPHADRLRKMLLAEDPGGYFVYPCLITMVTWKGKQIGDLIFGPSVCKTEGHHLWHFFVAGFIFTFFVSSHPPPMPAFPGFLQPSGSLIIEVHEFTEIDFLKRIAHEIVGAQKARAG